MKKKFMYLQRTVPVILLMVVNLYVGIHLIGHLKEFNSKTAPISSDEIIKKHPQRFAATLDIDNDKEDEVVFSRPYVIPDKQEISVFEPLQKDFDYHYYGEILVPLDYAFLDAYYNEKWKINVFRFLAFDKGGFHIVEVDNRQEPRNTISLEKLNKVDLSNQKIEFTSPVLVDLEGDGRLEMVIIFFSRDKPYKRGVVCFNPESAKLLWEYHAGTKITGAEFMDLDGQGGKEIILSSFAANNDVTVNGTSDTYCYVIVLDSKGNELWKKEVGNYLTFTCTAAADLDHDGTAEIVTTTERHHKRLKEEGVIVIFDAAGKEKKTHPPFPVSFSQPAVRLYGKDDVRIYVGDSDGNIRMFDRDLIELEKIEANSPVRVLNFSSSPEEWHYVYAHTHDRFLVYDRDLTRKIFNFTFKEPINGGDSDMGTSTSMIPIQTKKGNYALLKADRVYLVRESVLSGKEIFKIMVSSGLLPGIIFLLLFDGFYIYSLYRRKVSNGRRSGRKVAPETAKFLEIVQGIAQKLKNPISSVLWAAEKIKSSARETMNREKRDSYLQLSEFLTDDAEKMRRQTDHLLRLVQIYNPRFEQKTLKPILQDIATHYRILVEEKIDIQLEMAEDVSLPIDEELLREALANLIDNAVDAMPKRGRLRISALPVVSPAKECISHVLIEVEDTGHGMDEEELSQIFTPFFSKKEKGTGIGLTICRRIIEAHGGKIDIHSRKGLGTRITVTLPAGPGRKKD